MAGTEMGCGAIRLALRLFAPAAPHCGPPPCAPPCSLCSALHSAAAAARRRRGRGGGCAYSAGSFPSRCVRVRGDAPCTDMGYAAMDYALLRTLGMGHAALDACASGTEVGYAAMGAYGSGTEVGYAATRRSWCSSDSSDRAPSQLK
eukprot:2422634-Rhodomonas_salina.3